VDSLPATPPSGYATTTWNYDASTGLLSSKRDAATPPKGTDYTYDVARRLSSRLWARFQSGTTQRLLTTYAWNNFNQPTGIDYADSTPDVSMSYDRLGRMTQRSNGLASSDYSYDANTLLADAETIAYDLDGGGVDFTRVLDRSQDAYLRNSGFQLKNGSTVENEAAYRYDSAGRYGEVEGPRRNLHLRLHGEFGFDWQRHRADSYRHQHLGRKSRHAGPERKQGWQYGDFSIRLQT
jgi:hypothetical protein